MSSSLRRKLKGTEWQTLQFAVLWTFEAVAGSDGNIDPAERRRLIKVLVQAYRTPLLPLRELLMSVESELEGVRQRYVADPRGLQAGLKQAGALADHCLAPGDVEPFKRGLLRVGEEIAMASRGFLGFGKRVSADERRALDAVACHLGLATSVTLGT